jgi:hypothetical protein
VLIPEFDEVYASMRQIALDVKIWNFLFFVTFLERWRSHDGKNPIVRSHIRS